jgi:hypothetical protein
MNKLVFVLVLALGCSAADAGEDVGSLEQALTPCTLQIEGPISSGPNLTWKVRNVGQACSSSSTYTELYTTCSGCSSNSGRRRVSVWLQGFSLAPGGLPGYEKSFSRPKPPCGSGEVARVLASWIPTPGAARLYVSGSLGCLL